MLRTLCLNILPSTSTSSAYLSARARDFSTQTLARLNRFTRSNNTRRPVAKPQPKEHVIGDGKPDAVPLRPISDLWKALGFTAAVGVGVYTVAAVSEHGRILRVRKDVNNFFDSFKFTDLFGNEVEGEVEVTSLHLSTGQKIVFGIIAANCLVTVLWRIKSIQKSMFRYFTNSFASKSLCPPMLLSVFSHSHLIHLGLNMYVLHSFASASIDKFLGPEMFLAFYCTAGVVSSFTSIMHKAIIKSPIRALGASGAICGILAYTCMKIPEARLRIIFLPFFDFTAEQAIYGLLAFDFLGLIFRFRVFDHAAHLGGTLFGVFYAMYGEAFIQEHFNERIYRICDQVKGTRV